MSALPIDEAIRRAKDTANMVHGLAWCVLEEISRVELILAEIKKAASPPGTEVRYVLFYQPPCGSWYVHSHKLYETRHAAHAGANKFLHPDTPIAVLPVNVAELAK